MDAHMKGGQVFRQVPASRCRQVGAGGTFGKPAPATGKARTLCRPRHSAIGGRTEILRPARLTQRQAPDALSCHYGAMRELLRTNDIVLLSAVEALLDGAGIVHLVLDQHMSVMEGSIGLLPRRLLVGEDEMSRARTLLREAGLGAELRAE
jgi:hypothetical protein